MARFGSFVIETKEGPWGGTWPTAKEAVIRASHHLLDVTDPVYPTHAASRMRWVRRYPGVAVYDPEKGRGSRDNPIICVTTRSAEGILSVKRKWRGSVESCVLRGGDYPVETPSKYGRKSRRSRRKSR